MWQIAQVHAPCLLPPVNYARQTSPVGGHERVFFARIFMHLADWCSGARTIAISQLHFVRADAGSCLLELRHVI